MNEVLKLLEQRRSIRAYQKEQITDAQLEAILRAGICRLRRIRCKAARSFHM